MKEENFSLLNEQRKYSKKLYPRNYTLTIRMEERTVDVQRVNSLATKSLEDLQKMERMFDSEIKRNARALYEIDLARRIKRNTTKTVSAKREEEKTQKWIDLAATVHSIVGKGEYTSGQFCRELNKSIGNPFPGINTSNASTYTILRELAHHDPRFKLKRLLADTSGILKWYIEIK